VRHADQATVEAVAVPTGRALGSFLSRREAVLAIHADRKTRRAHGKAEQPRASHKTSAVHCRMMRRRAELCRLANHRRNLGISIERSPWALVVADALVFGSGGVDFCTFGDFAKRAGINFNEAEAMAAIRRVDRLAARKGKAYRPFHSMAVARMLDVTAEERWACDIRTIGAVDETPEQQAARRREERRDYERERSRRRRAGAIPRAVYEAQSLSRTEPWKALGISRSTWFRRGKPRAPTLPQVMSAQSSVVVAPAVRQVRPLTSTWSFLGVVAGRTCLKRNSVTARAQANWWSGCGCPDREDQDVERQVGLKSWQAPQDLQPCSSARPGAAEAASTADPARRSRSLPSGTGDYPRRRGTQFSVCAGGQTTSVLGEAGVGPLVSLPPAALFVWDAKHAGPTELRRVSWEAA
jgi:hypothetical protein